MLEVFNDVICLAVGEGCVVWVDGEASLTSRDSSVVTMRLKMRAKWLMRMFACCLNEGILSVVVMASCDCVVLLLESVMLFSVL